MASKINHRQLTCDPEFIQRQALGDKWKLTINFVQFETPEARQAAYEIWIKSLLRVKKPEINKTSSINGDEKAGCDILKPGKEVV